MVQINNNNSINYSKNVRFGEQAYTMPVTIPNIKYKESISQPQIPDIYTIDDSEKPSLKETFVESPGGMFFKAWIEHPIATLGTFIGLGFGMDWFAKNCGGEYEKSIVGKVANFGDKIHNSSFCQSEPMKKTGSFFSSGINKIKKFLGKSDALKAAGEMSVQPEASGAKSILYTTADEIVQEFSQHITGADGLGLNTSEFNKPISLKNLYVDKDVEKFIKDTYGKTYKEIKNTAEAEKIANHIVLKRMGLGEAEIISIINDAEGTIKTKAKVLEIMGKDLKEPVTPELLQKIAENPKEYRDTVRKIAENTKGKIWTAAGDYGWMGPIKRFFKRKISMDGIANKSKSIAKASGHTSTGRFFSKAVQMMYRGLTFGGGKLGAFIFIAPGLVEMAINTKKADKDKKVGTAAWGFINSVSWPIAFILGGKLMYGAASMKNAGISKEKLGEIDNIINTFNKTNEERGFKSFSEYWKERKACKVKINKIRKASRKGMSVFDKVLSKASGILSYDLKKFNGYRTNSKFTTFLNKIPVGIKGKSGLVLKFGLFMFAIQPLIDGVMHKCCNAIFGKDYDPIAEDDQKAAKKAQKEYTKDDLYKRLLEAQALKTSQTVNKEKLAQHTVAENIINKQPVMKQAQQTSEEQVADSKAKINQTYNDPVNAPQGTPYQGQGTMSVNTEIQPKNTATVQSNIYPKDNYTYIPSPDNKYKNMRNSAKSSIDNYTYIPSNDNVIKNKAATPDKKYIPAQTAGKFNKKFDNSKLGDAFRRADKAEQKALQILAGNFDNMN